MIRHSVLLITFFWLFGQVAAQQEEFNFINFNSENGLSSNSILAIIKDRYGYMWFASEDGLNKFDGANFTVYRHDSNDSTSIGEGSVNALCKDSSGNLWVGAGNTLSLYNRQKDAFTNYVLTEGVIRSLCIDHSGNIWIGTYTGLFILNRGTRKVKRFKFNQNAHNQMILDAIICVFEDSRKRVWIGTNSGLYLTEENTGSFKQFIPVKDDPSSFPDITARAITEDLNGNIWFGTKESGLCVLQPDGNGFRTYKHDEKDPATLSSNRIFAISADNEGRLWVGTEEGLDIFDPQSGKAIRIGYDQRKPYSFTGRSVRSIYIDKDDIYWIGTFRAGVNKYDKNLAFFNSRMSNAFDPLGLSSPIVTSFVEAPNGDIYMGTDGGGLNLFHRKTGLFDHPQLPADQKKIQSILALELVGDDLWIGTYPQGVYVWNTVTGAIKHYVKGNSSSSLCGNEIFCIKKDSKGKIWIGTNGNGLSVYDPASATFYRFDPNDPKVGNSMLPSNGFVRSIAEDRLGNIWVGSHGTGIAIYNPVQGTFQHLNYDNSNLAYDFVMDIYPARDGTIWVGTGGKGLCRFDPNTQKFVSFSESDGLANGFVYKILEDDSGKLWLSTNKGISSFDPKTTTFKNYSYYNGLKQSSYWNGAGIRTSVGEMFFGGLNGFNYFNPQLFHSNRTVPFLVFTDLKVANRSVMPGENGVIKEHISMAKEIRLNYKQNFSIGFVALNYTAPQENRYAYKLDGFDKTWNDAGSLQNAVYTNLPPGKYTFRLKARSEDGSWSTPERSIDIFVRPPFWLTPYAYILYILVAGLVLWGIRYRGIKKLKNKFALEQERQQFKQMLEEERREAERKREFDQVKIKFLTNLSHEFRTPVSLIVSPLEQLEREPGETRREQLSIIRRNARRLLNLVNQLLDFRKLEEAELKLNLSESDLVAFIKDVTESFKDISIGKHIDFGFRSSIPDYYTSFDKDKIERILFNLLSNAFKFTKEYGKISLKIEENLPTGIRIIVADTGVGMEPDIRDRIFEQFFQGDTDPGILNQGTGIGLSITREFVKLHGGTIDVESILGKGTVFTINLPFQPIARSIEPHLLPLGTSNDSTVPVLTKPAETAALEKPVVLLIDDHADFLYYLSNNLKSHYKIIEASDGKQGWQKVLSSHPQVIVSDISMPEMDGIALCRKIRSDKRTRHIPIILLTALTGNASQLKGLGTGANDYLTKPFNFQILNLKIKNLLDLNQDLKNAYSRQLKVVSSDIDVLSEDEKLLRSVIEYIETNLDSPDLSVEKMSKHIGMSRGALYNKIVTLTGETPVEFIRSVKMDKAAVLLENTDMKISQIGYAVGFTAPNYFAKVFKDKFNLSPSEFIKLKRKPD